MMYLILGVVFIFALGFCFVWSFYHGWFSDEAVLHNMEQKAKAKRLLRERGYDERDLE